MATVVAGGNLAEFMLLLLAGHRVPSCTTGAFSGRFRGFRDAKPAEAEGLRRVRVKLGVLQMTAKGGEEGDGCPPFSCRVTAVVAEPCTDPTVDGDDSSSSYPAIVCGDVLIV